jgi:hypothetical protein
MDGRESGAPIEPEAIRALGTAVGLEIDGQRLPAVREVLAELMRLSASLDLIDVEGVALDSGDPRTGWEATR